jgi:hypothetical protein
MSATTWAGQAAHVLLPLQSKAKFSLVFRQFQCDDELIQIVTFLD